MTDQHRRIREQRAPGQVVWDEPNTDTPTEALTAAAINASGTGLHNKIMNIPCKRADHEFMSAEHRMLYKNGHRDARHAAAELVVTHNSAPVAPQGAQGDHDHSEGGHAD